MNTTKNDTPTGTHDDPRVQPSDLAEEENSRRAALRSFGKVGLGLAFASAPAILASAGRAHASAARSHAGGRTVSDVLGFVLTLKYLEREFYSEALSEDNAGLIPPDVQDVFETALAHETAHVLFMEEALGLNPNEELPTFDFTAGGTFNPFNNYDTFLTLAQAFEDLGVRGIKGQVRFLVGEGGTLTNVLSIHSVEARHAAKVRRLRGLDAWIPFAESNGAPAAVYAGMDQTVKSGVDVPAVSGVGAEQVTEAWDEPLGHEEVLAILDPFIVPPDPFGNG